MSLRTLPPGSSFGHSDADITARIRSIFGEIAAFHDGTIRVAAGVVTPTGTVPAADDKGRAVAIVTHSAGVVTIQDEVVRNLRIGTKVAPTIGRFGNELRGFVCALPLFGVAVGAGMLVVLLGYRGRCQVYMCGGGHRAAGRRRLGAARHQRVGDIGAAR